MEQPVRPEPRRIIGYLAGWSADERLFTALDRAADKLTHINYAFGLIGPDGRAVLGDPDGDTARSYPDDEGGHEGLRGNFRQLQLLKARHPHLRTLISMGGWTGSGPFSDAAATAEDRRALAASCIELFLTRWPGVFDGIDIDWEYPVHGGLPENGYRPEDRRNCTLLFEELRRQLDDLGAISGQRYLLTAALPAGKELPLSTFELREIAAILDWINVMTYDISGSGESGLTNFNAPLHASRTDPRTSNERHSQNVAGTVRAFEAEGVRRDQIVVGMPFYGRGFTGVPGTNHGLYQPFTGTLSVNYHTIVADYLPTFQRYWHEEAEVPWLYDPESGTMLTYDDPDSIGCKAEYIDAERLGSAMFWELSGDDAEWSLLSSIARRLKP
jgi:chitinase